MKKGITMILAAVIAVTAIYAQTAVCYFSCTGNTKTLAENTAKALDATLIQIVPEVPYTDDDLNWNDKQSRTSKEQNDDTARPGISNTIDLSGYDTIILAFPIWWNTAPRIMFTFVEQQNLSGKKIISICTSGGSSISRAEQDLKAASSSTADWLKGSRFSAQTSERELKKYFDPIY